MTPKIWKPTQAECDLIKRAASLESEPKVSVGALRLEPGIRYNLNEGPYLQTINIAALSSGKAMEETDLADFGTWAEFRAGVKLTEDGRAIVDFYIVPRSEAMAQRTGERLLGNVVVFYEGGQITQIRGMGTTGPDYLPRLAATA